MTGEWAMPDGLGEPQRPAAMAETGHGDEAASLPGESGGAVLSGELPESMAHLGERELRLDVRDVRDVRNDQDVQSGPDGDASPAAAAQGEAEDGDTRPLADPAALELTFPDGVMVDETMLGNYRQFCVDCGLSPRQARQAAEFYMAEQGRRMAEEREQTLADLRSGPWAGRFDEKLARANYATHVLDRHLGGRLRPLVAAGLGNNGVFAEMMALVGEAVSEDAFRPQPGISAASRRQMSTEEYLRTEVFKER